MKAPALAKVQKMVADVGVIPAAGAVAGIIVVTTYAALEGSEAPANCREATAAVTTPANRKSHRISRPVHAVATAITRKMVHRSGFDPNVRPVSFCAALTMMPITAAPTP